MYFYMIRRLGTSRYYCGGGNWYSQQTGIIWWHDSGLKQAHKIFERLHDCEIVEFRYEEKT